MGRRARILSQKVLMMIETRSFHVGNQKLIMSNSKAVMMLSRKEELEKVMTPASTESRDTEVEEEPDIQKMKTSVWDNFYIAKKLRRQHNTKGGSKETAN
ncbi:hypothetical protein HAX54_007670 [Datura stramonium]|uniref:Uncharacterized protein n=1 Tax=Datura stramonium TaxID=4076 RepID=A0ABS8WUT4_DATST|nr:hypothetical protein [Datura stramonium]